MRKANCIMGLTMAFGLTSVGAVGADQSLAVYTADQAKTGADIFQHQCAVCHGKAMEGVTGPSLKGEAFHQMASDEGMHGDSLLTAVSQTMPENNPGSLAPEQYAQVVAYILQQNGYPPGPEPLTADNPKLKLLDLTK